MASYSFNLSPEQDTLLDFIVKTNNTQRELNQSKAEFVQARVIELLAPFTSAYKDAVSRQLQTSFEQASPATQAQIFALLKGS